MVFSKICICVILLECFAANVTTEPLPCKIPVFRYALEHWYPDPYEVAILHRGALSDDSAALVAKMEAKVSDPKGFVNLRVVKVDVEKGNPPELLKQVLGPEFAKTIVSPEIVLLYPAESQSGPLAWRGPLTAENVDALFDSPARKQITQWILDGESVVWVLVGVGDAAKDMTAERVLRTEIARLEKEIKMRDIEVIQSEKQYGRDTKVELRLGIKLLVLDPDDPLEKIFASTLGRSEDDLENLGEPFAIPVFGRGRAHLSLIGRGINPDMIEASCRFLIDDCSCEIKRLNPGVDLLFAVNWDEFVVGIAAKDEPLPDLAGIGAYTDMSSGNNDRVQAKSDARTALLANQKVEGRSLFGQSLLVWISAIIALGVVAIAFFVHLRSQTRLK